jgi:uncharacterized protein YpiB (UPF0302 family)
MGRYTYWANMRVLLTLILISLSPIAWSCGEVNDTKHTPFANVNRNSEGLISYDILIPKKDKEYFLTDIYLHKKDELYISLSFRPAFRYPQHHQSFIDVNKNLVDEYDIYINYSTTKDGGLIMCGGNVIKTSIKKLLSNQKAEEVIPPPPVAPPSPRR